MGMVRVGLHGGVNQHGMGLSTQRGHGVAVGQGAMLVLTVKASSAKGGYVSNGLMSNSVSRSEDWEGC